MDLPGWTSLASVKSIYAGVRLVTWCFWALLVASEVAAYIWKRFSNAFQVLALSAFALAVVGEGIESKYEQRKEELYEAQETALKLEHDKEIQQLRDEHKSEEDAKTLATSLFMEAQNGDANAYDRVLQMAQDNQQPLDVQWTARRIVDSIMDNYSKWGPSGAVTPHLSTALADDVRDLRSGNALKRLNALDEITYKVGYVSYTNAWPAHSPTTWHWTEKGREELKPYISVMDIVFQIMTTDSYLKIRVDGYKLFVLLAASDRPSSPGIKTLDNAGASSWWHANRKNYIQ